MADDRMKNDDLNRNMGGRAGEQDDQDLGQKTPGRNPGDQQKGAGQNKPIAEDDEFATGGSAGQQKGREHQGDQKR